MADDSTRHDAVGMLPRDLSIAEPEDIGQNFLRVLAEERRAADRHAVAGWRVSSL